MGTPATPVQSIPRTESNSRSNSHAKLRWPHRRTIIVLLTISALLIWTNADALLVWPAFYATWVSLFPWVAQLGNLAFILGVILGLVIDMGVVLYSFGFRVESAFIVFPAAIISLLIGAGFLAGLMIAVLTGIFIMLNENNLQATETQIADSSSNEHQRKTSLAYSQQQT